MPLHIINIYLILIVDWLVMSEKIREDFRKWQEEAKKKIEEMKRSGKGASEKIRKDYEKTEEDGKRLMERIQREADRAEAEAKKRWEKMIADAKKTREDLEKAWRGLTK